MEKSKDVFDSWTQIGQIVKTHAMKLAERMKSERESWVRLSAASKVDLGLDGGAGQRDNTAQTKMRKTMREAYCPDAGDRALWDPVFVKWESALVMKAVHLCPWKQNQTMDEIFGPGSHKELFSPYNGLFLHPDTEDALVKGHIAIVPDVELEPADAKLPQNDQRERNDRLLEWESAEVKNYKLVVLNKSHKEVNRVWFRNGGETTKLLQLDGRKLVFRTDFRPRARYVWWTFMFAILKNAWGQSQQEREKDLEHIEIRGLVEELGYDIKSILTIDQDKYENWGEDEEKYKDEEEEEEEEEEGKSYRAAGALVQQVVESMVPHSLVKNLDESDTDEEEEDGDE
ncbi:uncharacterized protein FTOL_10972 [Fusarium torulosum]|uniref:HNH nuclease domain-containing protein n=1 Tax=Fusarium torulosum TaxID=33205 RepID=A0AAE8MI90_9HYPO|nr:uncharacterized protein FTOL_10972 [Fusarium torulosum]